ncbi:MAG: pilus assembly protein PilP [Oleiphilaceae bacterium]|nr:pilus assembly protein PilP [Oleiphilaceae bacterium]
MKKLSTLLLLCAAAVLSGCAGDTGFDDLDRFMQEADTKPRGRVEPLPEVQVYRSFTYSAANRRSPFLPPAEVVISSVKLEDDQSNVKPNLDRPKEVLEYFSISNLRMVGTLQRGDDDTLWALIADNEGGVHMVKTGQYMGQNHGRVVKIEPARMELIEIVPNGTGGWLERPRTISLEDEA